MQEFVVELDQSELTKISDYIKWMDSMPASIKHDGSIEAIEYAFFGYLGSEYALERATGAAGIMGEDEWWNPEEYCTVTSISDDNKLTTMFFSATATEIKVTYIAK
jgi:hypothetical protein